MFLLLLVDGLNDKEKDSITEIYYEYRAIMKLAAMRYFSDENVAEDVVQDAFFRIRKHLTKINTLNEYKKRKYIINIVKTISIDYIRRLKRESDRNSSLDIIDFEIESKDKEVIDTIIIREQSLLIDQCIIQLSKVDGDLLKAKYIHGYSTKEICKLFDIDSENTARSMIHRAKKKLGKIIYESGKII